LALFSLAWKSRFPATETSSKSPQNKGFFSFPSTALSTEKRPHWGGNPALDHPTTSPDSLMTRAALDSASAVAVVGLEAGGPNNAGATPSCQTLI
jgi:hypothetical protein